MGKRKDFIGIVISDKMNKTIIVRTKRMSKHPKYGRVITQFNKFKVHDENNTAKIGDAVSIRETRPLSKDKRYRLISVIKKAALQAVELKDEALLTKPEQPDTKMEPAGRNPDRIVGIKVKRERVK